MDNNVIISIKGKQSFEGADDEVIELVTEGLMKKEGERTYTLSYQESELTGMGGTLTTFQIEEGRVTLLRLGQFNSQMVFEQGRRHLSMYETPYGALAIGVNTRAMDCTLDEHGGRLEVNYDIEIDHAVAGANRFLIDVREKRPGVKQ